ncbi:uncharacterized [Tachysurus ichikawai]
MFVYETEYGRGLGLVCQTHTAFSADLCELQHSALHQLRRLEKFKRRTCFSTFKRELKPEPVESCDVPVEVEQCCSSCCHAVISKSKLRCWQSADPGVCRR